MKTLGNNCAFNQVELKWSLQDFTSHGTFAERLTDLDKLLRQREAVKNMKTSRKPGKDRPDSFNENLLLSDMKNN